MIKFSVMFRQPDDIDNFENTYNDFLALVERMPDIERRQVVHVLGSPQGQAPYYRLLELYYADEMALRTALMSTAGQEAGNELGRFTAGSFDVQIAEVYEELGSSTPVSQQPSDNDASGH